LAGNGALLGVEVDYPRINVVPATSSQTATYDGTTLSIASTPVFVTFTEGGTAEFVSGGSLTITASINSGGTFSGGTFSISGMVTDTDASTVYSGILLSGTVADYGIVDTGGPGGTDLIDFAMDATGGSLLGVFGGSGADVNTVITLEGSSFAGSFAAPWSAARAKGDIGPPPSTPTVLPHTIGYWKNHPEAWPVTSLTICGNTLTQAELISILKSPSRKDVTIIMAKQLIAAMLAVAGGNSCPLVVDAEAWLCSHGGIGGNRKQWDGGEVLKDALDQFNQGGACSL
jgi:hypothetical protein